MTAQLLVVHYFVPICRELAEHPGIELTVAYASDLVREGETDRTFCFDDTNGLAKALHGVCL